MEKEIEMNRVLGWIRKQPHKEKKIKHMTLEFLELYDANIYIYIGNALCTMIVQDKMFHPIIDGKALVLSMHLMKVLHALPTITVTTQPEIQRILHFFNKNDVNSYEQGTLEELMKKVQSHQFVPERQIHPVTLTAPPMYSPFIRKTNIPKIYHPKRFKLPIAVDAEPIPILPLSEEELASLVIDLEETMPWMKSHVGTQKKATENIVETLVKKATTTQLLSKELETLHQEISERTIPLSTFCVDPIEFSEMVKLNKDVVLAFLLKEPETIFLDYIVELPLSLQSLELANDCILESLFENERIHRFIDNAAKCCHDSKQFSHKRLARCLLVMLDSLIRREKIDPSSFAYQIRPICLQYRSLSIARDLLKSLNP